MCRDKSQGGRRCPSRPGVHTTHHRTARAVVHAEARVAVAEAAWGVESQRAYDELAAAFVVAAMAEPSARETAHRAAMHAFIEHMGRALRPLLAAVRARSNARQARIAALYAARDMARQRAWAEVKERAMADAERRLARERVVCIWRDWQDELWRGVAEAEIEGLAADAQAEQATLGRKRARARRARASGLACPRLDYDVLLTEARVMNWLATAANARAALAEAPESEKEMRARLAVAEADVDAARAEYDAALVDELVMA